MGEAGSFRISRPEEVIQRNRSFPSGLRGNESVPGWVMSIEVSKDKSVRRVWKDVGIEGPTQTTPVLKFFFPTTLLYNSLTSTPLPSEALLLTLAPGPFQHFRFRVCFRFQPFSSKWFRFRFHKKLIASSFRFHIPGKNQC